MFYLTANARRDVDRAGLGRLGYPEIAGRRREKVNASPCTPTGHPPYTGVEQRRAHQHDDADFTPRRFHPTRLHTGHRSALRIER
jgi:hypothetical protein